MNRLIREVSEGEESTALINYWKPKNHRYTVFRLIVVLPLWVTPWRIFYRDFETDMWLRGRMAGAIKFYYRRRNKQRFPQNRNIWDVTFTPHMRVGKQIPVVSRECLLDMEPI